jgi:hypothetical protein
MQTQTNSQSIAKHSLGARALGLTLFAVFALLLALVQGASVEAAPEATFFVNTTVFEPNDGVCDATFCTLVEAIEAANDGDQVKFNIPLTPQNDCDRLTGVCKLNVTSELVIEDSITLDGYSQPGASPNTLAVGMNTQIKIVLQGPSADPNFSNNGLVLVGGGITVKGLALYDFIDAIAIQSNNNRVRGNFLGMEPDGETAHPQTVHISSGANNRIGGAKPAERNLIAGYVYENGAQGTRIQGNYFGTDMSGLVKACQCQGLLAIAAVEMTIGGLEQGEENVFGGDSGPQLQLVDTRASKVINNNIGVGADGKTALKNFQAVTIQGAATENLALIGNKIANSSGAGVEIFDGARTVSLSRNLIYNNARLGIDLEGNEADVTYNDPKDVDGGPNDLQNFPELTGVIPSVAGTVITGQLHSTPNKTFRIEFFTSPKCDSSGFGEGKKYLGTVSVKTNPNGNANFGFATTKILVAGTQVTATATSAAGDGAPLNTSEFSKCKAAS